MIRRRLRMRAGPCISTTDGLYERHGHSGQWTECSPGGRETVLANYGAAWVVYAKFAFGAKYVETRRESVGGRLGPMAQKARRRGQSWHQMQDNRMFCGGYGCFRWSG